MASSELLFIPLFLFLLIVHTQSLPLDNSLAQGGSELSEKSLHRVRRQDISDPLIPGDDDNDSTEAPPGLIGRAREGLQRFRERTGEFWEGVRDRVTDWFDVD